MAFFGCCSRRVFITSLTVFGLILLVSGTILTASHVFSKLIKDKVNEVSSIFIKIVFRIALKFSENVVFFCPVLDYITQFFFFFTGLNAASEYLLAVFLKLREQFSNSPFYSCMLGCSASLQIKGLATKYTTVKWTINPQYEYSPYSSL